MCLDWRKRVSGGANAAVKYKLETLRSPIDVGVSSAGILIPLIAALIAYLASESMPVAQLTPLGVSLVFLVAAVLVGLFNLFGMTSSINDEITITENNLTYVIPTFVLQFLLTAAALVVLLFYFLTSFQLPKKNDQAPSAIMPVVIARPSLRVGLAENDVTSTWGAPARVEKQTNGDVWHYDGATSQFEILIGKGVVRSVTEKAK
jgi:hypothetical protein